MNEMMSADPVNTEIRVAYLRFDQIEQNPFRDLLNNPLHQSQVDRLAASVRSTGFWDNVLVRPHPTAKGRYQLAYGHARIEAAREAGLSSAAFTIRHLSDDDMIRIMATENISQFGKDSFKTYKEATVAAATHIMREVLVDPKAAANFGSRLAEQDHSARLVNEIHTGGCPGRERIVEFYRGSLNSHDIELALEAFRQTGELDAWHDANNPKLKRQEPPPEPKLDPEALRHFDKPAHVASFVKAVQETKTPVADQKGVAERIVAHLGPEPKKTKSGRESFQGKKDPETRFNAGNIRNEVVKERLAKTRGPKQAAELERIKQMTSLEKALTDLKAGLSRTVTGCKHLSAVVAAMGNVTEADMTTTASHNLQSAIRSLAELDAYFQQRPLRKLLRIKGRSP